MTRVLMTVPRATEVVSGSAVTHSRGGGEMEGGMRDRQKETGEGRERGTFLPMRSLLCTVSPAF